MPELPEVQTVVSDLNKKIVNKTVASVWLDWPKMIKDPLSQSKTNVSKTAVNFFLENIVGKKVIGARRVAKNILIDLTDGYLLLIHQKMTGHLLTGRWRIEKKGVVALEPESVVKDKYNGYIHLIITFSDGSMLALSDLRKFAKVLFGKKEVIEGLTEITNLGPDALDPKLNFKRFENILSKQSRKIKTVLLDPKVIAGVGNIYSDDILWQAGIHPEAKPVELSSLQLRRVYKAMKSILKKAVKLRGTSTSDFRDTDGLKGGYTEYRRVYGRENLPCYRCKNLIKRIKIGGRSAHFCPICQQW